MSSSQITRRLSSGKWEVIYRNVYRVVGSPSSWHQSVAAACLWTAESGAASHRTAAALLNLDGFEAAPVELTLLRDRRLTNSDLIIHRTSEFLPMDLLRRGPITFTDATRTLLDLRSVIDESKLEGALDSALRQRLTSIPRLRWRLTQFRGQGKAGHGLLARFIDERRHDGGLSESNLETRLLRVIRNSSLPPVQVQYRVYQDGKFYGRVDAAYPQWMIAIEGDSYKHHSDPSAWRSDHGRHKGLERLGWIVLRFTWDELDDPDRVVAEIWAAIRSRQRSF